ncbi:MAG: hypothetical protein HF314_01070 [Ignavibacteria bacterium]|jgi:hypothetical protein|nr:hypothetical protein [Ignavibacteria bacterium]MCU7501636.1 hypothetical protein [Ignavibacteria bacterium]MCU7517775.1 hypothetical protein [Ignavibacteria bacterium]
MNKLTLDTFLYVTDFELSSYKILNSLKNYNKEFNHNRLYPGLSELIELNLQLKEIDENNLNDVFIENLSSRKSKDDRLMVETIEVTDDYIQQVVDLIEWAKPLVKDTIDEGKILYEFVKKNIYIEEIGIADASREEGYVLIPDNRQAMIQVLRYEISMTSSGKKSQRKLNTRVIQSVDKVYVNQAPNEVIMDLFEQFADMPSSSTFICTTDLDFPFSETILPVVKRKLMSRMAA